MQAFANTTTNRIRNILNLQYIQSNTAFDSNTKRIGFNVTYCNGAHCATMLSIHTNICDELNYFKLNKIVRQQCGMIIPINAQNMTGLKNAV